MTFSSPGTYRWAPRKVLRGAPATSAYLLTLAVTTATLAGSRVHVVSRLMAGASTNLHNMTWHPIYALAVSAFWVQSVGWLAPAALLMIVVMAPAERMLGTARTLLVFAAGHVGATVVTVGAIGVGVSVGWLPRSLEYAVDVGPSYGLAALGGVLALRLRPGLLRTSCVWALLVGLGLAAVIGADFTDSGHLAAALLGMGLSPLLSRTPHRVVALAPVPAPEARAPGVGGVSVVPAAAGLVPAAAARIPRRAMVAER
jgi:hypothetical protein